jgi:hypothetical protein
VWLRRDQRGYCQAKKVAVEGDPRPTSVAEEGNTEETTNSVKVAVKEVLSPRVWLTKGSMKIQPGTRRWLLRKSSGHQFGCGRC